MRAREKILAGLAGLAFAFGGAVGTQEAEANSINQVLLEIAQSEGVVGQAAGYSFDDEDRSFGAFTQGENVQVGDVITGSYFFDEIRLSGQADSAVDLGVDHGPNNALFGRFALEVSDVTFSTVLDRWIVSFQSVTDVSVLHPDLRDDVSAMSANNEMFTAYEGPFNQNPFAWGERSNFEDPDGDHDQGLEDAYYQATFGGFLDMIFADLDTQRWASFGESGDEEAGQHRYRFAQDSIAYVDMFGATDGADIAESVLGRFLNLDSPQDAQDGHLIESVNSLGEHLGEDYEHRLSTELVGTPSQNSFESDATMGMNLTVVPTPSASLAGLVGIGLLAMRRRRPVAEAV